MKNEKQRLFLIVILMFGWMLLINYLGLGPRPPKKAPPADQAKVAKLEGAKGEAEKSKPAQGKELVRAEAAEVKGNAGKAAAAKPREARVLLVDPKKLVLGSATDKTPGGYHMEVQLDQNGAGVESVFLSRHDAEFEGGRNPHLPLEIIRRDPVARPSLSLTLSPVRELKGELQAKGAEPQADLAGEGPRMAPDPEDTLDSVLWEVVPDGQGQVVRHITGEDPTTKTAIEGQEIVFRATAASGVTVTKTIQLWQTMNCFEVELRFESPDKDRTFSYNFLGPHGIPIEGEWYTGTFRDIFFGTYRPAGGDSGSIKVETHSAYDVAKGKEGAIESTTLPLRFTGVENQYFTTFMMPWPAPTGDSDRLDRETMAILLHKDASSLQKSDVGVRMSSKPIQVGPNLTQVHRYRVYAGPKIEEALSPFNAAILASYRKSSFIPGAGYVARYFITPTLSFTYDVTRWVAVLFGGTTGNWGVAIILMTLFVKLLMFPLGRKQALMAQRTQELQPCLKEIQEKYKDEKDKEKQTRETLALYKKHGVNPVSGCIPALIQLPIFVGLWQALNSSVALRHSPFLWIGDLAAPDMLFRLPLEIPFLGHWFNLLPIVVVGLMLFQTKLFSPPATTPEAEMQQKTMKFMMVFMAVMFYKVPSGLGIYFITSSLWSIGERLLLPKITHATPAKKPEEQLDAGAGGGPRGKAGPGGKGGLGGNGPAPPKKPPSALGQFWEKVLDDARKNPTYRKMIEDRDAKDRKPDRDDRRDRDRGKPRARPGRK
jgi:YidC/Oxa1 family membrane protein insertase